MAAGLLVQTNAAGYDHYIRIGAGSIVAVVAMVAAFVHLTRVLTARERTLPPTPRLKPSAVLLPVSLMLAAYLTGAARLGGVDAVSVAMGLMALAAGVDHRHRPMLGWLGLAVAVRPDALAIAPFVLALLIRRRVPIREWPIAAAIWLAARWITVAPSADSSGRSIKALPTPGLSTIVDLLPPQAAVPLTAVMMVAAIGFASAYIARTTVAVLSTRSLIACAALSPLTVAGLLPGTHGSAFLLASLVALAIAAAWPDQRSIATAAVLLAGSALAEASAAVDQPALAAFGAICVLSAAIALARPLRDAPANDNWYPARLSA
ncbi:hypothetical protein F1C10_05915 [Sphingomonas sp. NBWT7]|uniref:hypothetical protein n=1 Tax=Sphingomonas sp. NBWT7 TaxID=2596913 RepID=UPI0016298C12|nr:hypothetical protein [Sphingomonas sp. NBWT7]QNE31517.1 hypothetical protein F1C10_05915 [Sphingomonas sp. NBWT7]